MTDGSDTNLIGVITGDHRQVEAVFAELERDTGSREHRRELVDHVITELVRHSVAEEEFMYPAARRLLDDGDELADHEISEHAEAEQLMKELEDVDVVNPRFEQALGELISAIRHHVEDEEHDLLPKLARACDAGELQALGEQVLQAKERAPTRPHPAAPDKPPANRILAPGTGMIDKLRDALGGRNH